MVTREQYARAFLARINAPRLRRNLWALVAWMQAEGGNARFNPLNTTLKMPGSTDYNSVGVQNYVTLDQGLEATVRTLTYGAEHNLFGYRPIRRRLRLCRFAAYTLTAVENSAWGTGGLALQCLPGVKRDWDHYRNLPIAGS